MTPTTGTDIYFFYGALFLYALCSLFYIAAVTYQKEKTAKAALLIVGLGWVIHTISLGFRWLETGHYPMSDTYESLSLMGWSVALILLIMQIRTRMPILGAIAMPVTVLLMGFGVTHYTSPDIAMPDILKSGWLFIHVSITILSYGAFAVAFGLAVFYLLQEKNVKSKRKSTFYKKLPSLEAMDELSYRSIAFGFPLLTFGIISGSMWAEQAWGRYWGWDPKETWSLITWFIYGSYLHARLTYGWKGKRSAILAIAGFGAVLFTYFGVNFLLSGLHSYA